MSVTLMLAQHGKTQRAATTAMTALRDDGCALLANQIEREEANRCKALEAALTVAALPTEGGGSEWPKFVRQMHALSEEMHSRTSEGSALADRAGSESLAAARAYLEQCRHCEELARALVRAHGGKEMQDGTDSPRVSPGGDETSPAAAPAEAEASRTARVAARMAAEKMAEEAMAAAQRAALILGSCVAADDHERTATFTSISPPAHPQPVDAPATSIATSAQAPIDSAQGAIDEMHARELRAAGLSDQVLQQLSPAEVAGLWAVMCEPADGECVASTAGEAKAAALEGVQAAGVPDSTTATGLQPAEWAPHGALGMPIAKHREPSALPKASLEIVAASIAPLGVVAPPAVAPPAVAPPAVAPPAVAPPAVAPPAFVAPPAVVRESDLFTATAELRELGFSTDMLRALTPPEIAQLHLQLCPPHLSLACAPAHAPPALNEAAATARGAGGDQPTGGLLASPEPPELLAALTTLRLFNAVEVSPQPQEVEPALTGVSPHPPPVAALGSRHEAAAAAACARMEAIAQRAAERSAERRRGALPAAPARSTASRAASGAMPTAAITHEFAITAAAHPAPPCAGPAFSLAGHVLPGDVALPTCGGGVNGLGLGCRVRTQNESERVMQATRHAHTYGGMQPPEHAQRYAPPAAAARAPAGPRGLSSSAAPPLAINLQANPFVQLDRAPPTQSAAPLQLLGRRLPVDGSANAVASGDVFRRLEESRQQSAAEAERRARAHEAEHKRREAEARALEGEQKRAAELAQVHAAETFLEPGTTKAGSGGARDGTLRQPHAQSKSSSSWWGSWWG